ncbi:MAG: SDR family oxidoreductase [Candidatus Methylomirabilaceae bacterium]
MSSPLPKSPVLVTGSTGFVGRELTRRLVASGRPVIALARQREGWAPVERVAAAVGLATDGGRLEVIEGDLTLPGCGLQESQWRRLRDSVETVFHCAGETTFFPDEMARFRAGHIDGPLGLLEGLAGGRLRRWLHLSTAYVCGRRSGVVLEREGDVGQRFHNPYEQVKLESELAIRRAGAQLGADVRVFRPSVVVGPAPETAGGQPANLFFGFIRMVAAVATRSNGLEVPLRIAARPGARFNIVPVEYVTEAVAALAEHPEGAGQTFHLVVSDAPTQERMAAMIMARLGLTGLSVVDSRYGGISNASPLERKVARMTAGYREYLEQDVRFDDATARRLLDRCGVPAPLLSTAAVDRLIDQALGVPPIVTPQPEFHPSLNGFGIDSAHPFPTRSVQ